MFKSTVSRAAQQQKPSSLALPSIRRKLAVGTVVTVQTSESLRTIAPETSAAFRITRVLCIFFMVYVHVNPGLGTGEQLRGTQWDLWFFHTILADLLGRASVPALSVISGFLAVHTLERRSYRGYAAGRFTTLFVPMVVWNTIGVTYGYLIFKAIDEKNFQMENIDGLSAVDIVARRILALDETAAYTSHNFLRDMFVCSLAAPIFVALAKRSGWAIPAIVVLAGETIGFEPVVYRESILIFFVLGIQLAISPGHISWLRDWRLVVAIGSGLVLAAEFAAVDFPLYQLVKRGIVSAGIALAALYLARLPLGQKIVAHEPQAYPIFLSHNFVFGIFWGAWMVVFGSGLTFPYVVFYLLTPVLLFVAAFRARRFLSGLPGAIRVPLFGK